MGLDANAHVTGMASNTSKDAKVTSRNGIDFVFFPSIKLASLEDSYKNLR